MSEPEAQGFTGGAVDAYDSGGRPLCPHEKLAHHIEVVIVGIGTVKLCDACRRLLATCERCSAFEALTCKTAPPRRTWFYNDQQWGEAQPTVDESDWCRDGFRQARPWTLEEARRWLGLCKHCGAELPEGADDGDCKTCAREGMLTEGQRAYLAHPRSPSCEPCPVMAERDTAVGVIDEVREAFNLDGHEFLVSACHDIVKERNELRSTVDLLAKVRDDIAVALGFKLIDAGKWTNDSVVAAVKRMAVP